MKLVQAPVRTQPCAAVRPVGRGVLVTDAQDRGSVTTDLTVLSIAAPNIC